MQDAALVDWDFCLMDSTPSRFSGIHEEFIESPRLDNLGSTFSAFEALVAASSLQANSETPAGESDILMAVAFDHEEVGSQSVSGANSSLLEVRRRIAQEQRLYLSHLLRCLPSVSASVRVAHRFHERYRLPLCSYMLV